VVKEKNHSSVDVPRWMYSVDEKLYSLTIWCWTGYVGMRQRSGGPFRVCLWRFAYFEQSYDCVI